MRIIVHFVPKRPKRTIIRTRHDQCQPIADHARSIASNIARSSGASNTARSPSAEAKAPPTMRPTAPLRTSRKGNRLNNGAAEQVFGHLKDELFRGRASPDFESFRGRAWPDLKSFRADLGAYVALWSTRSRQVKLKGLTPEEFRSQSLVA